MSPNTAVDRLSDLISAAAAVVGEVDLDNVLRRLVTEAKRATSARYAALGVLGPHGVLTEFLHEGLEDHQVEEIGSLPRGRGVLGTVVRGKATLRLDDISEHPDSYGFPDGHPPMKSFLGVPIRAGDTIYGNLYLTEKDGGFTAEDTAVAEALAVIAGSAVNTARLRDRLRSLAVVEDRDRIARDLHDTIIQDLFAVGLSLQGLATRLEGGSASTTLDTAVDSLHRAVEALRTYIYQLRRSDDLRLSLGDQIHDIVDRMGHAYPADVRFVADGELLDMEPIFEEEIIKLVSEALSNALRHSLADSIDVHTRVRDGVFELRVSDDGVGFDVDDTPHGMGILNMRERARRLGGVVDLQSSPGDGTAISFRIPVA